MGKVERQEVIQNIIERLRMDTALGNIPITVAKDIVAVINAEPIPKVIIISGTASDVTSATIFTTHATKRTWLTYATLTVAKDVLSPSTFSALQVVPGGKLKRNALLIRYEPLTANQHQVFLQFNPPILLEKGSDVDITNTSATASIDTDASIGYYEEEP